MRVLVNSVNVPAMSTIGYGHGHVLDDDGEPGSEVTFAGDHRAMVDIAAVVHEEGPVECEVEGWQIIG